jgi:hypothetical protein
MAVDFLADNTWYRSIDSNWGINQYVFTRSTDKMDLERKADEVDGSTYGSDEKSFQRGLKESTFSVEGTANMSEGEVSDVLDELYDAQTPPLVWFAPQGNEAGDPVRFLPVNIMTHNITTSMKDPVKFKAEMKAYGANNHGNILLPGTSLLSGASGTGTAVIKPAATTRGAAAQLHLLSLVGGTSPTVAIALEESDDDGDTWTALKTFPTLSLTSAPYARITIPSVTSIAAQVRAKWTVTGAPTEVQAVCVFGRR